MKTKKKAIYQLFVTIILTLAAMFVISVPAAAAEITDCTAAEQTSVTQLATDSTDDYGIVSWLDGITKNLKYIALAIGVIAIIALAIVLITGGAQGLQKGKGMAISILVGIAVLAIGTSVVSGLYTSASSSTSVHLIPMLMK